MNAADSDARKLHLLTTSLSLHRKASLDVTLLNALSKECSTQSLGWPSDPQNRHKIKFLMQPLTQDQTVITFLLACE